MFRIVNRSHCRQVVRRIGKNAPNIKRSFNFAIFINNTHGCDKYSTKLRTEPHCFCQHSCEMSTRLLSWYRSFVPYASVIVILYEIRQVTCEKNIKIYAVCLIKLAKCKTISLLR